MRNLVTSILLLAHRSICTCPVPRVPDDEDGALDERIRVVRAETEERADVPIVIVPFDAQRSGSSAPEGRRARRRASRKRRRCG